MPEIGIFELMRNGFAPVRYPEQKGEFLAKTQPITTMPKANAELVDHDMVTPEMLATTEITPAGMVQTYVPDADVLIGPYAQASEEGQALLRDAIATLPLAVADS